MRALFQNLPFAKESYINFYEEKLPRFSVPWHFHPEAEIMHITQGSGTRFVGDHIDGYECGDICLIGANLQHEWRSDQSLLCDQSLIQAQCNVLFFLSDILGETLTMLDEMSPIKELLEKSKRGIRFYGESRKVIEQKIEEIFPLQGIERFIGLIELLALMASQREYQLLSSEEFVDASHSKKFQRFNKVYEYMIRNYTKPITIAEVASIIGLTPQAFCQYFKQRTGMTFTCYLNKIRISAAKKLLFDSQYKIATISSDVGFNNLSHFIEQFKRHTGMLPREYREKGQSKQSQ